MGHHHGNLEAPEDRVHRTTQEAAGPPTRHADQVGPGGGSHLWHDLLHRAEFYSHREIWNLEIERRHERPQVLFEVGAQARAELVEIGSVRN